MNPRHAPSSDPRRKELDRLELDTPNHSPVSGALDNENHADRQVRLTVIARRCELAAKGGRYPETRRSIKKRKAKQQEVAA